MSTSTSWTSCNAAFAAALLTVLSATASAQPLPHATFNRANSGAGAADSLKATTPDCTANGLCLTVTLALADSNNPNLCGASTNLSVDVGDQVNVCYTVTNHSSTTLNYQSLTDNHVGTLLTNNPVTLAPNASFQYNRTITASSNQITDTGTFTSTWTSTDVLPGYGANDTAATAFVDISATGTSLTLGDDNASAVTIPFSFTFYGTGYTNLCIGNNGEMRFGVASCSSSPYSNRALPASTLTAPAVLSYWQDILGGGNVYYGATGTAPHRQFIVEYKAKFAYGDSGVATGQTGATWEVVLNEADGTVDFVYQTGTFGGVASAYDNGAGATIGLQSNSVLANQYSYDTATVHDGMAIVWTPLYPAIYTATASATLDVGAPTLITTPNASSGFTPELPQNTTATLQLQIDNIGSRTLDWSLSPPSPRAHFPKTARVTTPIGKPGQGSGHRPSVSVHKPAKARMLTMNTGAAVPVYAAAATVNGSDYVTFDAVNPANTTVVMSDDVPLFGITFVNNDLTTQYGLDYFGSGLYSIKVADGSTTFIGNNGLVTCCYISPSGMRWDPATGNTYLVITDFHDNVRHSTLYTIDLTTAATTLVGPINALIRDITIDASGLMYGIDSDADTLVAIDKTNGDTQTIGSLGFDAIFGEGLDFDPQTGILYLASASEDTQTMYTVDPISGLATELGAMTAEIDGMAVAKPGIACSTSADAPWLSYDLSSGTIAPDPDLSNPSTVNLNIDTTGLGGGTYTAYVCVYSNDPVRRRNLVPVKLTVDGPPDAIFKNGFEGSGSSGPLTLAQTSDMSPVAANSAACGDSATSTTADNQYWRRYYFNEYSVGPTASIASVDVAIEQTSGAPDFTVTLYTIPHSTPLDTIDLTKLTQIGQATLASPADASLTTVNVPVTGTVSDTSTSDLVVEVSTDDGTAAGTAFYIGSTTAPQTHFSFLSSSACGTTQPTSTATLGFGNMHIIEAVHVN